MSDIWPLKPFYTRDLKISGKRKDARRSPQYPSFPQIILFCFNIYVLWP